MDESDGGEERSLNKMIMEVVEGETGFVGDDLASSGDRDENHEIGGVDEESRDSCFLVLGV